MNYFKIILIPLLTFSWEICHAQDSTTLARSEYYAAEEAFNKGEFENCIKHLKKSEEYAGNNYLLEYLRVKAYYRNEKYEKAQKATMRFFSIVPEEFKSSSKYQEILGVLSEINTLSTREIEYNTIAGSMNSDLYREFINKHPDSEQSSYVAKELVCAEYLDYYDRIGITDVNSFLKKIPPEASMLNEIGLKSLEEKFVSVWKKYQTNGVFVDFEKRVSKFPVNSFYQIRFGVEDLLSQSQLAFKDSYVGGKVYLSLEECGLEDLRNFQYGFHLELQSRKVPKKNLTISYETKEVEKRYSSYRMFAGYYTKDIKKITLGHHKFFRGGFKGTSDLKDQNFHSFSNTIDVLVTVVNDYVHVKLNEEEISFKYSGELDKIEFEANASLMTIQGLYQIINF